MPVYDSVKEIPNDSKKMEWLKRDGKVYTGKDMERILKEDKDKKTVKKLEGRVGTTSKVGAYATDAARALGSPSTTLAGQKPKGSQVKKYKEDKKKYDTAKKRLEENKYRKGGSVSKRADGCAQRGKTRGKIR